MFLLTNFYFRPYEFLAVYQRFTCDVFIPYSYLIYIRALRQLQK